MEGGLKRDNLALLVPTELLPDNVASLLQQVVQNINLKAVSVLLQRFVEA